MRKSFFASCCAALALALAVPAQADEIVTDTQQCLLADGKLDKACVEQVVQYWEGQIKEAYTHNKTACTYTFANDEAKRSKCYKDLSESLRLWRDFRKKMLVVYRQTNCNTPEKNESLPFYLMVIQLTKSQVEVYRSADLNSPE